MGLYPQDLGLPRLLAETRNSSRNPLDSVLKRKALFKQAICSAYEGHKPLTVSGKDSGCIWCLWMSRIHVAVHGDLLCVLYTIAVHVMLILKYVPFVIWVCDLKRSHSQLQNEYQYVVFPWLICMCLIHRKVTVIMVDIHYLLCDDALMYVWWLCLKSVHGGECHLYFPLES